MHPFLFQSHRKISYPARFISILGIISSSLVCVIPIIPVFDLLPAHFALCIFESKLLMFSCSRFKSISRLFVRNSQSWFSVYNDTLCEKCPNTEFFLVRILPYSDQKKLRIWTHFTQQD